MARPYVEFKRKRLGKRIDYDGRVGYQCVDLRKQYMDEVIGTPMKKAYGNAHDIWTNSLKPFDNKRTQHKGTNDLMQGDVICLFENHIGILDGVFTSGTTTGIKVLDQNGSGKNSGDGLGENAVHVHIYNPSVIKGVRRCQKIFDNLELERGFIEGQLTPKDPEITKQYQDSIRHLVPTT